MSTHDVEVLNLPRKDGMILFLASVMSSICNNIAVLAQFYDDGIRGRQKHCRLNADTDNDVAYPGMGGPILGFQG